MWWHLLSESTTLPRSPIPHPPVLVQVRRTYLYTQRQFVGVVLTVVLLQGTFGLVKMWAARHSTHEGVDGVVGQAVNAIF